MESYEWRCVQIELLSLSSQECGDLLAVVKLNSDESAAVTFTVRSEDGISVAVPNPDIFSTEPLAADEVRAIIAAVLAFDRVAAHP